MSAIRQPGKLNEHTTLIDIREWGFPGITAVYLVEGERACLIDGGTREEAPQIVSALRECNAFPPGMIIVTHPHYDHTQGIPYLRAEAAREGKSIQVMASQQAVALLHDQSFNEVYGPGPYENVADVTPLAEGDVVDLGGVGLRIYDVPGHCQGHIAILDEGLGNLFVGDALGNKLGDNEFIPAFMSPFWDWDAFYSSVDKLKHVSYGSLCLAHFGYIYGSEAQSILEEAASVSERWWQLLERNVGRLEDTDYMVQAIAREVGLDPQMLRAIVGWLVMGYRAYRESRAADA